MADCDACLLRLLDIARTDIFFRQGQDVAIPEILLRSMFSLNSDVSAKPERPSLPYLAIRLVNSSIQVLKKTWMPDSVELNWVQTMAPAFSFRSGEADIRKQLLIEQPLDGIEFRLQLIPTNMNQIDMEIRLTQTDQVCSGIRVVLKKDNTILHSQKTDAFGILVISHVQPGKYRLQIPAREIDWILDIQPESESKAIS
jgi:hypothetical protein